MTLNTQTQANNDNASYDARRFGCAPWGAARGIAFRRFKRAFIIYLASLEIKDPDDAFSYDGLFAAKAKTQDQLTRADGLSGDAEPSERVAPATAHRVSPVSWSGSIGLALSDSESGDPKPTPSQTDGRRCRDALGDNQQPHGRHVRRIGVVHE